MNPDEARQKKVWAACMHAAGQKHNNSIYRRKKSIFNSSEHAPAGASSARASHEALSARDYQPGLTLSKFRHSAYSK